ncbi:ATP-binding protein [Cellulosimicrobium terreum]|nr:ATP-binding protein [Cellulosimicrobium terreum]
MTVAYSEVPTRFVEIDTWELHSMTDLAALRSDLHRTLTGRSMPPDRRLDTLAERLVLVASELATNGLRHGTPPVSVRLLRDGPDIVVDVVDHSPDAAPRIAAQRAPGAGGFGLVLARRAARDVGWFRTSAREKHVWARFDGPTPHAGATARRAFALMR